MSAAGGTTTTTIGGKRYTISHVPTSLGILLGARVANMAAPGFAGLSGDTELSTALGQLLRAPDLGPQVLALALDFAEYTEIEIKPVGRGGEPAITQTLKPCFDAHFAGRYDHFLEWLVFVIQWDLSSFLDGAFAAFKKASAAADALASKSKSPNPAEGTG